MSQPRGAAQEPGARRAGVTDLIGGETSHSAPAEASSGAPLRPLRRSLIWTTQAFMGNLLP